MDNRAEIQDFLSSRRGRVQPQDVGLPGPERRRRVPGLKREEVALLAGVSVDYYARLERGQLRGVSDQVLEAIADALRLDEAERTHLRDLAAAAGASPRRQRQRPTPTAKVRASVVTLLESMTVPAYVRDARFDILAANQACVALYDGVLRAEALPLNLARFIFLDARSHALYRDWDEVAEATVASLRAQAGRDPMDKPLTDLIGELMARSHPFATAWAKHDVGRHSTALKRLRNAEVGDLELTGDALELSADGLTVIVYTAAAGSADEEKLRLLCSWNGSAPRDDAVVHHGSHVAEHPPAR
ncbi:helix-turn-helix domain-containing protein [Aestuariimicrobium ganziense]|uniref:helix-turn-helix domain-containing protein n=1 Tax=Aestuariimicrobium ganziense TaxID=2773677 RepID=UPI001944828A|nr:helix-turn-helix domain-containing protein [Aestuariimicrobium ganziense]